MTREEISKLIQDLFELELDLCPKHSPSDIFAENILANLEEKGVELCETRLNIERTKDLTEPSTYALNKELEKENSELKSKLRKAKDALQECAEYYRVDDVNGIAGEIAHNILKE